MPGKDFIAMKKCKRELPLLVASLTLFCWFGSMTTAAWPEEWFHNGGAGRCDACHGKPLTAKAKAFQAMSSTSAGGSTMMLKYADASSTCLSCHEAPIDVKRPQGYFIASNGAMLAPGVPPAQLTPGGDFGWLKKEYNWSSKAGGEAGSSPGERHGHNIVAVEYGYVSDSSNTIAPSGTYPSQQLSCISCHDPHGSYKRFANNRIVSDQTILAIGSGSYTTSSDPTDTSPVGSYRLLAGKGYRPKSAVSAPPFTADPPAAVAPALYNRSETATDTRVAYGSGMSEWCQNCHSQAHSSSDTNGMGHPTGSKGLLSGQIANNYNGYIATGNLNGTIDRAYTSMVPFEMGTNDYTKLKAAATSDGSYRRGAEGSAKVMCLTCHRAHASAWDNMTRWDTHSEYLVFNGRFPDVNNDASGLYARGRTSQEIQRAFYERSPAQYEIRQRSLCSKCHVKD